MSGNTNTTVAIPGKDNWDVWWWNGLGNFQLDIVGFLAVLGEEVVRANAQVAALSRLFYLPRILPAPQALIRTSRPTSLPMADGKVTGVLSGNVKDNVQHVANIFLNDKPMEKFNVRCVQISERKRAKQTKQTWTDLFFRGQSRPKRTDSNKSDDEKPVPSLVKARATGPLTWVTLLGFIEALTLLIASILFGDGMSLIATILLAGLSTIVGIINKWTLKLVQPPKAPEGKSEIPKGDVVIRYPNGSFLVVKCSERAARELFFAPEEIDYAVKSDAIYRLFSLMGTLMLMLGIVALANAKLWLQVAWAGAYILSNIAHWIAAALPPRTHWDISTYALREEFTEGGPENGNFTDALWKAILLTQSIEWVRPGRAAPRTKVWDDWLADALKMAQLCADDHDMMAVDGIEVWWPVKPENDQKAAEYKTWMVPDWNAKKEWDKVNESRIEESFPSAG